MPYGAPKMNSYVVETYCRPKYQYMHQYFHHLLIMLDPFTEEEFECCPGDSDGIPWSHWQQPGIGTISWNWLTSFLPLLPLLPPNDCSKLAKVALMLKAAQELNKILHPFYHHSLRILYSRHWCSFILLIFHSQLLMQLTLLIYQYYDELIRGLLSNSILYFQSLCIDIETGCRGGSLCGRS